MEDEYAIVSKKEFMALKKEIERLKKNPLEGSESGETIQASIDNLNKSLNVMLEVFKQAADDMKLEDHDSDIIGKQMDPLHEKLDTLIDQNQKIAKGIVAVADMVKEKLDEISEKAAQAKEFLPPLSGGPGPRQAPFPRHPAAPPSFGSLPSQQSASSGSSFGSPDSMDLPPFPSDGLPPFPPASPGFSPDSGKRRDIMEGLMK